MAENRRAIVCIEDTKFIFKTNFSGDPERDTFGSTERKANIIIPEDMVEFMVEEGYNVKVTKPRPNDDDYEPTHFVVIKANYNTSWPPRIYLVSGNNEPVLLDEESLALIDECYVKNVKVVLNPYENRRTGRKSLYIKTMYVEKDDDDDPYADFYRHRADDDHPF